jgi:hypothetical protein
MFAFGHALRRFRANRLSEQEADLMAAKVQGDISGAVYFLKTEIAFRKYWLNRKSDAEKRESIRNLHVTYWKRTHPSCEERVSYLEALREGRSVEKLPFVRPGVPFSL